METPYRVGILGATGLVGQRLVGLLDRHPWFRLQAVAASERSVGRTYGEATRWALAGELPQATAALRVRAALVEQLDDCDVVLSALDSAVAERVEPDFRAAGFAVISNSSTFRQSDDVPLMIPEVNLDHLLLVRRQAARHGGFIVTNPNCSTTGLALVLAPLHRRFGLRRVVVTTLQAISGAGADGPRALDLTDNVLPYIAGEEEKIERELGKILGRVSDVGVERLSVPVSAHCHRVPVIDGHLEAVSLELEQQPSAAEASAVLAAFPGLAESHSLPTAPPRPIVVLGAPDRPQPRLDRDLGNGMTVAVGRVRPCPVLGLKLVLLSHNTLRGAAGGTLLNAEALARGRAASQETRALIVMKFGGTSVANGERIRAVAAIVSGRLAPPPVIVVSALAGVTDLLVQALARAGAGDLEGLEPVLADVERRHRWALAASVDTSELRHDFEVELQQEFEHLRQQLRSIRVLGEHTPRASDAVLAFGDTLAARIVATAFRGAGLRARYVDPRAVIRTDARFGAASARLDETRRLCAQLVVPLSADGIVPVTAGFVGSAGDGATTTLGRGGSDTSAAVLALALGADEVQIWTDVDGLMSADPRRVPEATTLPRVSFAEAAELALAGARVLHPASIAPAVEAAIPVRVRNSLRPAGPDTRIEGELPVDAGRRLASLACRAPVSCVRLRSRQFHADPGFRRQALAALDALPQVPERILAEDVAVCAVFGGDLPQPFDDSALTALGRVERLEGRAWVRAVGAGLTDARLRGDVLRALADWQPDLVLAGTSPCSVGALVDATRVDRLLQALHERFIGPHGANSAGEAECSTR